MRASPAFRPERASATLDRRPSQADRSANCAITTASGSLSTETTLKEVWTLLARATNDSRRAKAQKSWPGVTRIQTSVPIPLCPPTPGYGPPCNRLAAARGAGASSTWNESLKCWEPGRTLFGLRRDPEAEIASNNRPAESQTGFPQRRPRKVAGWEAAARSLRHAGRPQVNLPATSQPASL